MAAPWRWLASLIAAVLAFATVMVGAPAVAAPVYQITGAWDAGTPTTVGRGDVLNAVWHVNVNDDQPAPSNGPVDNVTFTVTAGHGLFKQLPDLCLTTGVTPASSISADGRTLTCNLGTVAQGTAVAVQTPIVADGATGDQLTAVGEINGQQQPLTPVRIQNKFGMDMQFGGNTPYASWNSSYSSVLVDLQWTLRLAKGSDPGPATTTYRVTLTESNGKPLSVGTSPQGVVGCSPFNSGVASGVPWSELPGSPADKQTSFVDNCSLTPVAGQAGVFDLKLTGIHYDVASMPSKDSTGDALPTDWNYIASGSLWLRVATTQAGGITLTSNAPTYRSTTGLTSTDLTSNNSTSKTYTLPGGWAASWWRPSTGDGGNNWDDSYRLTRGDMPMQYVNYTGAAANLTPTTQQGQCLAFDTNYVTYTPNPNAPFAQVRATTPFNPPRDEKFNTGTPVIQYYVGNAVGDPDTFNCGSDLANWTTTQPADLTRVKAIKVMYPHSIYAAEGIQGIQLNAWTTIKSTVPAGQDVWTFGSVFNGTSWITTGNPLLPTPNARYANTDSARDILRIVLATPAIRKAADRAVVKPGEPTTFTLTYSANGAGAPATVDGYRITDTLPAGMTYVAGSATPAPTITTAAGQQVLTWTLNGVTTNAEHALTYQAVAASSVQPGQVLTNSATSTLGTSTTPEAKAQVTVSTAGYTTTVKTADAPFIPNVKGDGKGTGSWTVTVRSYDPVAQPFTDTIDILPYNGDGRGTAYSGSYTLTSVSAPAGATVYYTTKDPATLSDDPSNAQNGSAPGTTTGNTAGWTTTKPAKPTAIRVIAGRLAPGATQQFGVHIATDGVKGGDTLVNRAQGIAGHTTLVMRTSAPITVANYYSAALKKEVQDADGNWHDANSAVDYPTFRAGDQVKYRITVTNTGQGTLTNLVIDDDKFTEGDFTIPSLDPGKSTSFNFAVTLNGGGTVVNTACGTADIPSDSQVAPTINCDPAGVQVTNYTTVKSSNPASGATVHPGDRITYTVTVTQQGDAPAVAAFTDSLAKVLDDATYQGDVAASIGTATVTGDTLSWNGMVPVGQIATITYSVIVKDAAALAADGDYAIGNQVTSAGCVDAASCATEHEVAAYRVVKSSDPAKGSNVQPGDTIDYTITVTQQGKATYQAASFTDDLTQLLDDATWNGDLAASAGTVAYDAATQKIAWNGDLAVGAKVTITYSVTVTGVGDTHLVNVVTSDGCWTAEDCTTEHWTATYTTVKTASPASGSDVQVGDTITYTVTVTQAGLGNVVAQFFRDDLTNVTDDATFDPSTIVASSGTATYDPTTGRIDWTGTLGPDQVATVTYQVVVTGKGDTVIGNTVTSPGCGTPADCTTVHHTGIYSVEKTSNPVTGSDVQIGDTIQYTVTVRQKGTGPVNAASFRDDLSAVLDDATWNNDLRSTDGGATYAAPVVDWAGRLAVGDVVTVTYSVTVTGAGDTRLTNVVTSDGCATPESCTTTQQTGDYTVAKTSAPTPGTDVKIGDTITYTVTVTQRGLGAVKGASAKDDLTAVLDDATWNDDQAADSGTVTRSGNTLTWKGDLAVAQFVTITYSVTVTGAGDMTLTNQVVPGDDRGECVPAPDQNPDCTTTHKTGSFTYSKMSDPKSPATVAIGDTVTYTVTVTQVGPAAVPGAALVDDLSGVLDDATFVDGSETATAGTASRAGNALNWNGDLALGQVVTITYQATVTGGGDTTLRNTVAPPPGSHLGECVTAPDGTPACETTQKYGGYVYSKTSEAKPGTKVKIGDTIRYTVTVAQTGAAPVTGHLTDDLSKVLDDASWVGDEKATAGTVSRAGNQLTWSGPLAIGQTVTITYTVTVTGEGDKTLTNVVTSPDPIAACVPASDGNPHCTTTHELTDPPTPALPGDPGSLASTGSSIGWGVLWGAVVLLAAGGLLVILRRRRDA